MIPRIPKVPLFALGKSEPKWITREQAHSALGRFPPIRGTWRFSPWPRACGNPTSQASSGTASMLERRCCYVPGYLNQGGEPIPVPLNDDAIAVLARWGCDPPRRSAANGRRPFTARLCVPGTSADSEAHRRECGAGSAKRQVLSASRSIRCDTLGRAGRFRQRLHCASCRSSAAGLRSDMPLRYAHLDPGHLADYADRSLVSTGPPPENPS